MSKLLEDTSFLPQKTTVYIGHIAHTVEENFIRKLFLLCGSIRSWKPMIDLDTKISKGFGFVDFESPDGVLRSLRLIDGLEVDGLRLIVKVNQATQTFLKSYTEKKLLQHHRAPCELKSDCSRESHTKTQKTSTSDMHCPTINDEVTVEDHSKRDESYHREDADVLKRINELLTERSNMRGQNESSTTKNTTDEHNKIHAKSHHIQKQKVNNDSNTIKTQPLDSCCSSSTGKHTTPSERHHSPLFSKRMHSDIEEDEREYILRSREWERYEDDRRRWENRDNLKLRELKAEREKAIQQDAESADSDEEREPWQRKAIRTHHSSKLRHVARDREEEDDDADRQREREERSSTINSNDKRQNTQQHNEALEEKQSLTHHKDSVGKILPSVSSLSLTSVSGMEALKKTALSVFQVDDDEQEKERTNILPLPYDMQNKQQEDEILKRQKRLSPQSFLNNKTLMSTLPSCWTDLNEFTIEWGKFDQILGKEDSTDLKKWIASKLEELLGEEESSMTQFVFEKVMQHTPAASLYKDLYEVLEDDAKAFIIKLYRIIIYEIKKHENKQ